MSQTSHRPLQWLASRLLAAPIIIALILAGLPAAAPTSAQESDPLRVVATFSILGDWVSNVGGDRIEVVTIVPAGGDAHTFDPNPEQVASVADADLIVEVGAGFEPWLDDMVAASGSEATRVIVSDGLDLIGGADEHDEEEASPEAAHEHDDEASPEAAQEHEGEEDGEHAEEASPEAAHADHSDEAEDDHGHEHEPGEVDPHIWHDVTNAIAGVETIRAALGTADSANAATYTANAAAYTAELAALDAFIRDETATLPEDRRKLVTSHDTFGYFARAYGFEIVGTALSSLTTETNDPPAQEIAALVDEIESSGVPAIFAENVSNTDLMDAIATEAGVTLAPSLYTDALGEAGSEGETYLAMMRFNITTIVIALGG